ncbi:hypothetical protein OG887_32440 [Streptomyces sp. NBC_00053]|uniref:hypothetical protein n=1 Tax=unclassified Streptomyces TaxID=2593676 RepID=UPI0022525900|nr:MULTISPECIES: hypothetical protein [unclassified Streptomyces]MCX5504045.1 hypothetical protein [Streptomyces sp. NBC_00052]MCX5547419.1 hypothetical protein [Streptomyces sp. NBC_00051]WSC26906.1 hypothetical protein OG902_09515 [Streptomyces sp. NBC_01768]
MPMNCPWCNRQPGPSPAGRCRCAGYSYETGADAWTLHQELVAELEADEKAFFERVQQRTEHLRSLVPAWQRTHWTRPPLAAADHTGPRAGGSRPRPHPGPSAAQ